MRTYKLTIAYDGTRYQGWQRQSNTDRTIQGILEQTISGQIGYDVEVNGSGRTDAGVHAKGQTASVMLPEKAEENFFTEKINEVLPEDIRILSAKLVKNGFHARKSAVGKTYEYHIDTGEKPDVFTRKYAYHFPNDLDVEKMKEAARLLAGTHEFAGYTDKRDEKSTKRTIYDIIIRRQNNGLVIEYTGTGFLYHMVRILTGTLLEVGIHQRTPQSVSEALKSKDRARAGFLAPAKGLFLRKVYY